MNRRGKPLVSHQVIGSTATETGLKVCRAIEVRGELDARDYPKGIKVTGEEMTTLSIKGDTFHPEWNYTISPRAPV